jgi:hypothetical protein
VKNVFPCFSPPEVTRAFYLRGEVETALLRDPGVKECGVKRRHSRPLAVEIGTNGRQGNHFVSACCQKVATSRALYYWSIFLYSLLPFSIFVFIIYLLLTPYKATSPFSSASFHLSLLFRLLSIDIGKPCEEVKCRLFPKKGEGKAVTAPQYLEQKWHIAIWLVTYDPASRRTDCMFRYWNIFSHSSGC